MTDVAFFSSTVSIPTNSVMFYECSSCGALLNYNGTTTEKHRQWHKDNDRIPINIQT